MTDIFGLDLTDETQNAVFLTRVANMDRDDLERALLIQSQRCIQLSAANEVISAQKEGQQALLVAALQAENARLRRSISALELDDEIAGEFVELPFETIAREKVSA